MGTPRFQKIKDASSTASTNQQGSAKAVYNDLAPTPLKPGHSTLHLDKIPITATMMDGTSITVKLPPDSTSLDLKMAFSNCIGGHCFQLVHKDSVLDTDFHNINILTGSLTLVKSGSVNTEKQSWLFTTVKERQSNYDKLLEMGLGNTTINQLEQDQLEKAIIDFDTVLPYTIRDPINQLNTNPTKLMLIEPNMTVGRLCRVINVIKKGGKLDKITTLHLPCNNVSVLPKSIGLFTALHTLFLSGNRPICQSLDVSELTQCLELQTLSVIGYTQLNLTPLAHCLKLQILSLTGCKQLKLTPLAHCLKLQILSLTRCEQLNLTPLAHCLELQILSLTNCEPLNLTPLNQCPKLRSFFN